MGNAVMTSETDYLLERTKAVVDAAASEPVDDEACRRWRLILGADADNSLNKDSLNNRSNSSGQSDNRSSSGQTHWSKQDQQRDKLLEQLYRHEFSRRGGNDVAMPIGVSWLNESRNLFPNSAIETLQRDALERYGMVDLLNDPQVLQQATPNIALVQTLMSVREAIPAQLQKQVLAVIRKVVEQLQQRLEPRLKTAFSNRRLRHGSGGRPRLSDLDWPRTLRHNLRHYQPEQQQLVLERLFFFPRAQRYLPWHVWLVVDQSGSMIDAMIYSAVIAGIFARLPAVSAHLLLFDTDVVDVTDQLHAPEQLLLGAQLGGGTNIGIGLAAAREQIEQPARSLVVLISDMYEGVSKADAELQTRQLVASGVTVLALGALDEQGNGYFNREMGSRLTRAGAEVACMTPDQLVDWFTTTVKG
jgi:Mg-chelatase subunit ChlD